MTRKDFRMIAKVVLSIDDPVTRLNIAARFAAELSDTCARFDRNQFMQAATLRTGE